MPNFYDQESYQARLKGLQLSRRKITGRIVGKLMVPVVSATGAISSLVFAFATPPEAVNSRATYAVLFLGGVAIAGIGAAVASSDAEKLNQLLGEEAQLRHERQKELFEQGEPLEVIEHEAAWEPSRDMGDSLDMP